MASRSWSSSRISSKCIRVREDNGTLNFVITNYLQLKGSMGVDKSIASPAFKVGGHDWHVDFYPDGVEEDRDGRHAAAYVCCHHNQQHTNVTAKFTLTMLHNRSQVKVASFDVATRIFSPHHSEYGYANFVDNAKLESMSQLPGGGCFTILCVLTVVVEESPPMELPGLLERMLAEGRGADVTFRVGGHEFRGHKIILAAQSPVFRAQFFGPMAKKDTRRVKIIDVEPAIFQMMLHYIYTESLPPPPREEDKADYSIAAVMMQHLLVAANMYGIERLKLMCEDMLCKFMDEATVMTTYALANQHHCNRLKNACLEFMSSKKVLATILETDMFLEHLLTSCQPLSLDESPGQTMVRKRKKLIKEKKIKRTRTKY